MALIDEAILEHKTNIVVETCAGTKKAAKVSAYFFAGLAEPAQQQCVPGAKLESYHEYGSRASVPAVTR
jgi:hypothetical protein